MNGGIGVVKVEQDTEDNEIFGERIPRIEYQGNVTKRVKEEEDYFVKQETFDADTPILDSAASEMGDRLEVLKVQRIIKRETSPPSLLAENVSFNNISSPPAKKSKPPDLVPVRSEDTTSTKRSIRILKKNHRISADVDGDEFPPTLEAEDRKRKIPADESPPTLQVEEKRRKIVILRRCEQPTTSTSVNEMPRLQSPQMFEPSTSDQSNVPPTLVPVLPKQQALPLNIPSFEKQLARVSRTVRRARVMKESTKETQTVSPLLCDQLIQTSEKDLDRRLIHEATNRLESQQSKVKNATQRICPLANSIICSVYRYFIEQNSPMPVRETSVACGVSDKSVQRALKKGQPLDADGKFRLESCTQLPKELSDWYEKESKIEFSDSNDEQEVQNSYAAHLWSFFEKNLPTKRSKFVTGGVCKRCNKLVAANDGDTKGLVLHLKNCLADGDYFTLLELKEVLDKQDDDEDGSE